MTVNREVKWIISYHYRATQILKKHNETLQVVKSYIYNCLWRKANMVSDVSVLHNVGDINTIVIQRFMFDQQLIYDTTTYK